eukprot:8990898-Alexandrium_andersonii.AAC.1
MVARLLWAEVPSDEVYDTRRPIRVGFDYGRKPSVPCRFKVPKPVGEVYGKCNARQKAAAGPRVAEAMRGIAPDFCSALRKGNTDKAWRLWNQALQGAWAATFLRDQEDDDAYLGRGTAVRQNGLSNAPAPYQGEEA